MFASLSSTFDQFCMFLLLFMAVGIHYARKYAACNPEVVATAKQKTAEKVNSLIGKLLK